MYDIIWYLKVFKLPNNKIYELRWSKQKKYDVYVNNFYKIYKIYCYTKYIQDCYYNPISFFYIWGIM